jgi:hypothetical protein
VGYEHGWLRHKQSGKDGVRQKECGMIAAYPLGTTAVWP